MNEGIVFFFFVTFVPQGTGLTFPLFIQTVVEDTEISVIVWGLVDARVKILLKLTFSITIFLTRALHAWKMENQFARPFLFTI